MPIKSYLAHPHKGKKNELMEALSVLEQCEVIPSHNEELLILITETDTTTEEEILKEKLDALESLKLLALVSGFNTQKN
ncbi:hypothetical protein [Aquimarina longa]|uniref:hypothetical protein n=1 Tax=Aquimarina longa TaxID=1080221 RepID=UPI0007820782|nr:hypothetical protein [Aquimarina longa]